MSDLALLVVIDAAVWATWGTAVGLAGALLPDRRLARDTALTRPRRAERDGRAYERLGIRHWKDLLPEAGGLFLGGVSKRRLPAGASRDAALERFAAETRRAEYVHWAVLAAGPFFLLWNPAALGAAMVAYGLAANLPCIAVQRYNRLRIARTRARRSGAGREPLG